MLKKNWVYLHLILILILLPYPGYSQSGGLRFTHLTCNEGLSHSNITDIIQDKQGFMWFGTFNGLNRYDGYTFKTFRFHPGKDGGISHNYISSLESDHNGDLWVGTGDGLNFFDHETHHFTIFQHDKNNPKSLADNQIEALLEDQKGQLWIGTRNAGLERFDREKSAFIHFPGRPNDKNTVNSDFIRVLFEDRNGNVWIGHSNGAIDVYDNEAKHFHNLLLNNKKLTDSRIHTITQSPDGDIWVGTQGDGLYRLTQNREKIKLITHFTKSANNLNSNIILSLHIVNDTTLWIGTEDNGLYLLNLITMKFSHYQHDPYDDSSLSDNSIWTIYSDETKNIWLGTFAYGINLLSKRKSSFQHYQYHHGDSKSLSNNLVNTIVEDSLGNLWIGTDGGGLNYFDRKSGDFTVYNTKNSSLISDVIVSLFMDKNNHLWIGSWSDGLYRYDREDDIFLRYSKEKDGLGSNRIMQIISSKNGGFWLCSFWGGLTYFNPELDEAKVYRVENSGLSDNNVRAVLEDYDGILWIGSDIGLDRFDPTSQSFQQFSFKANSKEKINKGFIHCITQTSDSIIWIGTTSGLNKLNPHTLEITRYTDTNVFLRNEIKSITEDAEGFLWISSNNGIARFDPGKIKIINYDVSDGLQSNEFNTKSALLTSNNELVLGGNQGFNIFKPDDLKINPAIPPVIITDFKLFNKSVSIDDNNDLLAKHISSLDHITLSWKHSVFSFDFVSLNYLSPEKNRYSYIMEGFETSWNSSSSSRTATYTNLDPGNYVFRVKASNNDGVWNEKGTSIGISITPPFWKTWWAYCIEILLSVVLILLIANYYSSRRRLQNALKLEHLELEKLFELDQSKSRFFSNISHEFHSPMTLILDPVKKLISLTKQDSTVQKSLLLIQRNAQRLHRMINQLRDFQKIESGDFPLRLSRGDICLFIGETVNAFREHAINHQIDLVYSPEQNKTVTWFDPDKLDKIIYNLLSNAFKFTPDGGKISVTTSIHSFKKNEKQSDNQNKPGKSIEIKIQDNGIGISEDNIKNIFRPYYQIHEKEYTSLQKTGSGIGLSFVQELVKAYGGQIKVNSEKNRGTEFTINIPLDERYLEENQLVGTFIRGNPENIYTNVLPDDHHSHIVNSEEISGNRDDIPVVLLVDDDKEIHDYIRNSLEEKYRFLCASNGNDGIKNAESHIPDLIISDVKMPQMNGIKMCDILKGAEKTSHIPIIMLTAHASPDIKIAGLHKGADAYLQKPFNIDILEAQINNLLQSRKKLREKFSHNFLLEPDKIKVEQIDEKFLKRIIKIVEKNIDNFDFNAEIFSKEACMSRMQLYRKLRSITNQTVHEFIHSIRLKRAVQLLEDGQMTITEIAYAVGYNDLSYFARCFRKQYSKSPSEFISKKL